MSQADPRKDASFRLATHKSLDAPPRGGKTRYSRCRIFSNYVEPFVLMPVSVIIPAYNAARTLGETLASVPSLSATGREEIIVVDDGSTDTTAEIAAAMPGVRLLRQANAGTAAALNAGMAIASGDILGLSRCR